MNNLPMMPQGMSNMLPATVVRPIDPDAGIFSLIKEGFRAGSIANTMEKQARSAEALARISKANQDAMFDVMTFSLRCQEYYMGVEHKRIMYVHEQENARLTNENLQIENRILLQKEREATYSADITELDARARANAYN